MTYLFNILRRIIATQESSKSNKETISNSRSNINLINCFIFLLLIKNIFLKFLCKSGSSLNLKNLLKLKKDNIEQIMWKFYV